jgi:rRNA maturation protein Nop10
MKLKFYINEKKEKVYTLKETVNSKKTEEAHYKFIKLKDAKYASE